MEISPVDRYRDLLDGIKKIAIHSGRDPKEITLLAVTKGHEWQEIEPYYTAGHRLFGESRVQELQSKVEVAPADSEWHFIGRLQKNKVRKVVSLVNLIHSVDSFELAQKISECSLETSKVTEILVQINMWGEESKQGVSYKECVALCDKLFELPGISVQGLMTISSQNADKSTTQRGFAFFYEFREKLRQIYGAKTFPHLSMGMSNDYPLAIAEGATILRIGSVLF